MHRPSVQLRMPGSIGARSLSCGLGAKSLLLLAQRRVASTLTPDSRKVQNRSSGRVDWFGVLIIGRASVYCINRHVIRSAFAIYDCR